MRYAFKIGISMRSRPYLGLLRSVLKRRNAFVNKWLEGNLELLEFLRERKDVLGMKTCSWAAHNGHLECLKYAHENGCPWDEDLF